MTPFEIIICTILYLIAYGYMIEKMIDSEMDASEKATCLAVCVFFVIYAPLLFGIEISKKLTAKNEEEII